jgi:thioredoxin reductase
MIRTVDLVIVGYGRTAFAAAVEALQRGQRVLVVVARGDARAGRRVRRRLRAATSPNAGQVAVMTGAEVVCVDGVAGVEAVVLRYVKTGRLRGVNASAFYEANRRRQRRSRVRL